MKLIGAVTMYSARDFISKTFFWVYFLMATTILLIICYHLSDKDLKGAAVELPFFFLNLMLFICNTVARISHRANREEKSSPSLC
jgi:hypothetical protein